MQILHLRTYVSQLCLEANYEADKKGGGEVKVVSRTGGNNHTQHISTLGVAARRGILTININITTKGDTQQVRNAIAPESNCVSTNSHTK